METVVGIALEACAFQLLLTGNESSEEKQGLEAKKKQDTDPALSGKRDSDPRPLAWEANALPTELFPQSYNHTRTETVESCTHINLSPVCIFRTLSPALLR